MANRISTLTMTSGIFAVLAALAVAYGVRSIWLEEEVTPPPEKVATPETFKVPLAAVNLPVDRVIAGQDTFVKSMTRTQFEKQFPGVNMDEVLASVRSVVNRRLIKPIKQGQPFLTTDFYLMGVGPSVAAKLQPGFRAIRVEVPNTREAGVRAGMFVDVFFRANARPARADQPAIPEKTLTLLRHIEVLNAEGAVTSEMNKLNPQKASKPMLFTLAVPESKVDMFGVIAGRGELWLVPTPEKSNDGAGYGTEVADASTLAGLLRIKPPQPATPPFETAIYQRGNLKINQFVDGKLVTGHSIKRQSMTMSDELEPAVINDSPSAPEVNPPPAAPAPGTAPVKEELPTAPPAPEKEE